jgi:hypothetical protein
LGFEEGGVQVLQQAVCVTWCEALPVEQGGSVASAKVKFQLFKGSQLTAKWAQ